MDRQTDDSIMPIADHTACSSTIGWNLSVYNTGDHDGNDDDDDDDDDFILLGNMIKPCEMPRPLNWHLGLQPSQYTQEHFTWNDKTKRNVQMTQA